MAAPCRSRTPGRMAAAAVRRTAAPQQTSFTPQPFTPQPVTPFNTHPSSVWRSRLRYAGFASSRSECEGDSAAAISRSRTENPRRALVARDGMKRSEYTMERRGDWKTADGDSSDRRSGSARGDAGGVLGGSSPSIRAAIALHTRRMQACARAHTRRGQLGCTCAAFLVGGGVQACDCVCKAGTRVRPRGALRGVPGGRGTRQSSARGRGEPREWAAASRGRGRRSRSARARAAYACCVCLRPP